MNSENVVKNLRALWRTDRIIAEIRMKHMLVGLGLRAFAALIAAFGLLMLELSAYFALVQIWSAISAAAILGGFNFVIAAVLFVIAGRPPSGRELELANEIHGSAVDALQTEARALQSQFFGMVQHPLNSALPMLLVPLITIIVKSLKKSRATAAPATCQRTDTDHRARHRLAPHNPRSSYRHVQAPAKADPQRLACRRSSVKSVSRWPANPVIPKATTRSPISSWRRSIPKDASIQNSGGSIARPAGSRGNARTRRTS